MANECPTFGTPTASTDDVDWGLFSGNFLGFNHRPYESYCEQISGERGCVNVMTHSAGGGQPSGEIFYKAADGTLYSIEDASPAVLIRVQDPTSSIRKELPPFDHPGRPAVFAFVPVSPGYWKFLVAGDVSDAQMAGFTQEYDSQKQQWKRCPDAPVRLKEPQAGALYKPAKGGTCVLAVADVETTGVPRKAVVMFDCEKQQWALEYFFLPTVKDATRILGAVIVEHGGLLFVASVQGVRTTTFEIVHTLKLDLSGSSGAASSSWNEIFISEKSSWAQGFNPVLPVFHCEKLATTVQVLDSAFLLVEEELGKPGERKKKVTCIYTVGQNNQGSYYWEKIGDVQKTRVRNKNWGDEEHAEFMTADALAVTKGLKGDKRWQFVAQQLDNGRSPDECCNHRDTWVRNSKGETIADDKILLVEVGETGNNGAHALAVKSCAGQKQQKRITGMQAKIDGICKILLGGRQDATNKQRERAHEHAVSIYKTKLKYKMLKEMNKAANGRPTKKQRT